MPESPVPGDHRGGETDLGADLKENCMRARTTMTGLALTAGLALSLATAGLASAGAPSADRATTSVVSHKAATTKAEQQRVEDYWTPARMKNAIPVGVKVKPDQGQARRLAPAGRRRVGDPAASVRQGVLHRAATPTTSAPARRPPAPTATWSRRPDTASATAARSSRTSPSCRRTTTTSRPYGTWTAERAVHHRPVEERRGLRLRRRLRGDERERRRAEPDRR